MSPSGSVMLVRPQLLKAELQIVLLSLIKQLRLFALILRVHLEDGHQEMLNSVLQHSVKLFQVLLIITVQTAVQIGLKLLQVMKSL